MRALVLLAAALALAQLWRAPSHPGWDAQAFLANARDMAEGGPYYEWVREPGMPALLAAALGLCGWGPAAERACAAALYVLPVAAAAALARREGEGAALLAALLAALCPLALVHGGQLGSDVACAGLSAAAIAAWRRDERLGCLLAAVASSFRYPAAALCIALVRRRTLGPLALALALAFLPWLSASHSRFGDPLLPIRVKLVQQQRMAPSPWWYYLAWLAPALGPAALAALLARRRDAAASFVLISIALLSLNANKEPRYLLLAAPVALALAAEALARVGRAPALALLVMQAWWGLGALAGLSEEPLARVEAALYIEDQSPGVVLSDVWVPLAYYGGLPARWLPDEAHLEEVMDRYGATHVAVSDRAWEPEYATEGFFKARGYESVRVVERGGERVAVFRTGRGAGNVTRIENLFDVNG